jgi:hypothetical protein
MQPRNTTNMTNRNNDNQELSELSRQVEDNISAKYGEGLSSRVIVLSNNDELDEFTHELRKILITNDCKMDSSVENWLDSEFNRIYVTYAYPDVTKVN